MASVPTIHQVAKRAGVSTATVSRVLTRLAPRRLVIAVSGRLVGG